jgi:hypothetical protein
MDSATQRTWRLDAHTCEACAVLEATVDNDRETGRAYGRKYAVYRAT